MTITTKAGADPEIKTDITSATLSHLVVQLDQIAPLNQDDKEGGGQSLPPTPTPVTSPPAPPRLEARVATSAPDHVWQTSLPPTSYMPRHRVPVALSAASGLIRTGISTTMAVKGTGILPSNKDLPSNTAVTMQVVAAAPTVKPSKAALGSDEDTLVVHGMGFDASKASHNTIEFSSTTVQATVQTSSRKQLQIRFVHLAPANAGELTANVTVKGKCWNFLPSSNRTTCSGLLRKGGGRGTCNLPWIYAQDGQQIPFYGCT